VTPAPNVVDSSAWLERSADDPNAGRLAEPLARPDVLIVQPLSMLD
jgi:hypothetical protein